MSMRKRLPPCREVCTATLGGGSPIQGTLIFRFGLQDSPTMVVGAAPSMPPSMWAWRTMSVFPTASNALVEKPRPAPVIARTRLDGSSFDVFTRGSAPTRRAIRACVETGRGANDLPGARDAALPNDRHPPRTSEDATDLPGLEPPLLRRPPRPR